MEIEDEPSISVEPEPEEGEQPVQEGEKGKEEEAEEAFREMEELLALPAPPLPEKPLAIGWNDVERNPERPFQFSYSPEDPKLPQGMEDVINEIRNSAWSRLSQRQRDYFREQLKLHPEYRLQVDFSKRAENEQFLKRSRGAWMEMDEMVFYLEGPPSKQARTEGGKVRRLEEEEVPGLFAPPPPPEPEPKTTAVDRPKLEAKRSGRTGFVNKIVKVLSAKGDLRTKEQSKLLAVLTNLQKSQKALGELDDDAWSKVTTAARNALVG